MRLTAKRIISALLITVAVVFTATVGFVGALSAKLEGTAHFVYALAQNGIDPARLNQIIEDMVAENTRYAEIATTPNSTPQNSAYTGSFASLTAENRAYIGSFASLTAQSGAGGSFKNKVCTQNGAQGTNLTAENSAYTGSFASLTAENSAYAGSFASLTAQSGAGAGSATASCQRQATHYYNLAKAFAKNINQPTAKQIAGTYFGKRVAPTQILSQLYRYQNVDIARLSASFGGNIGQLAGMAGRVQQLGLAGVNLLIEGFYGVADYVQADEVKFNAMLKILDQYFATKSMENIAYRDMLSAVNFLGGAVCQIKNMDGTLQALNTLFPQLSPVLFKLPVTLAVAGEVAKTLTVENIAYLVGDLPHIAPTVVNASKLLMGKAVFRQQVLTLKGELNRALYAIFGADEANAGDDIIAQIEYFSTKTATALSSADTARAEEYYQRLQNLFKNLSNKLSNLVSN